MRVTEAVPTFLYTSVIAAGCLHRPDVQISLQMTNYELLGWVRVDGRVVSPSGRL